MILEEEGESTAEVNILSLAFLASSVLSSNVVGFGGEKEEILPVAFALGTGDVIGVGEEVALVLILLGVVVLVLVLMLVLLVVGPTIFLLLLLGLLLLLLLLRVSVGGGGIFSIENFFRNSLLILGWLKKEVLLLLLGERSAIESSVLLPLFNILGGCCSCCCFSGEFLMAKRFLYKYISREIKQKGNSYQMERDYISNIIRLVSSYLRSFH